MQSKNFRVTGAQKRTMKRLKALLAEAEGCSIFSVAKRFRRKKIDFLAMPRGRGPYPERSFVRVRPTRRGRISVQGFGTEHQYVHVKDVLKKFRKLPRVEVRVYWHYRQLPYVKGSLWSGWYEYFLEEELVEVFLFHIKEEKRRPFD